LFEILKSDLAGRIGILHTNHGKIETPAFVPVIHPVKQSISTKKIQEIGFNLVITNAYITRNHFGNDAIKRGIHNVIDFDGAIMTDSGGYQVLEYGEVPVSAKEMAQFEKGIKSDFAIPLDKPTGFGLPKKRAKEFVDHTLKISKQTLDTKNKNGQIWLGPIQGGEHFDLVKKSTKALVDYQFPMLALGSPVEFMESYEFKLLAQMIITAKKEIPYSIPLHLFGAGHPLTIPFAVALGCDTFDSASYMLYAKQGRYITEDRTRHIEEMSYFSCNCEVCTKFTPKEIMELNSENRRNSIGLHNLFAIKSEVDRVKEAIHEGRLWEYVMKKFRAHPKLYEVIDVFTTNSDFFIESTPKFKEKAIFLFSYEDQLRPEVLAFHEIVSKFKTKKKILVILPESKIRPGYLSSEYISQKTKIENSKLVQFCQYNQFLGLIPIEISDMYPAAHYVMSNNILDPEKFPVFEKTWKIFFEKNKFDFVVFDKNDSFISYFSNKLPNTVKKKSLVLQK